MSDHTRRTIRGPIGEDLDCIADAETAQEIDAC